MAEIIERTIYLDKIKGYIDKDIIKVITGIRRSGKSEILKLIKAETLKKTDENHIVFINFEDIQFDNLKTYKELNDFVLDNIKDDKKYYLFFDEIQIVKDWEKAINSLRLKNTDIYITGSNSKLLAGEFATLIGGRYVQFEIRPLNFKEFINFRTSNNFYGEIESFVSFEKFRNGGPLFTTQGSTWTLRAYGDLLDDFINYGGFPFLSTQKFSIEQSVQIIKDIHSSIVLRDIVSRNNIKNVPLLEKIILYFYGNVGNLTTLRNIADYISGGDKKKLAVNLETIGNYVGYLETAYVIKKVQRYDIKGKKIFETNDKYYLADHSLLYAVKDVSKANKAAILENIVYNELVTRGYNVFVGKLDTREIDFIAEKNGEKIYVQVCLEFSTPETYAREFSPLKEIKDNYPKYVVSLETYVNKNDEGIVGISLKDFLLGQW